MKGNKLPCKLKAIKKSNLVDSKVTHMSVGGNNEATIVGQCTYICIKMSFISSGGRLLIV